MSGHAWNRGRRGGFGDRGGGGDACLRPGAERSGGGGPSQAQPKKNVAPLSRGELRRILHDKLEWNEHASELQLALLVCADEECPAEAEMMTISAGDVIARSRFVRSDIVEAQLRADQLVQAEKRRVALLEEKKDVKKESEKTAEEGSTEASKEAANGGTAAESGGIEEKKERRSRDLFRIDPLSKTHKVKVLSQIKKTLAQTWCGLLFVPSYQMGQATNFILSLNPKLEVANYVDSYVNRLTCLEDLLWALRSARGFGEMEPPALVQAWESLREEDMPQLHDYAELTSQCLLAVIGETLPEDGIPIDLMPPPIVTGSRPVSGPYGIYEPSQTPMTAPIQHHYGYNVPDDTIRWVESLSLDAEAAATASTITVDDPALLPPTI